MPDDDRELDRPTGPRPDPTNLTDPRAMRALAHPLRMALIEVLGMEGTATATRCAELLHESQANCSFHLRTLARYGFVEEAPSDDRRERPWRLTTVEQSWPSVQPDVASAVAADQLSRVFVQREADRALRWIDRHHDEPEEWQRAAFVTGVLSPMTAGELTDLRRAIGEVLEPYIRRVTERLEPPAGARPVRLWFTGVPVTFGDEEG